MVAEAKADEATRMVRLAQNRLQVGNSASCYTRRSRPHARFLAVLPPLPLAVTLLERSSVSTLVIFYDIW